MFECTGNKAEKEEECNKRKEIKKKKQQKTNIMILNGKHFATDLRVELLANEECCAKEDVRLRMQSERK
jgi:hypothetical protein